MRNLLVDDVQRSAKGHEHWSQPASQTIANGYIGGGQLMPASKVPPPEMNTTRIYYRDENNVSKPFGWISDDHSMILLDEGEVLSRQSDENLMNRNGVVYSRYDTSKAYRLVHWIIHSHRILGVDVPKEIYTLLQMREDDSAFMPDLGAE